MLVAEARSGAEAQDPGPSAAPPTEAAAAVYPADFFAAYRPITLLDMLDRIPGVSLAFRQDEERRGLRTNTDQVLINGKQISAKDNNSLAVLRRISAAQVERIEVMRGAVAELEMTSARIVNIVLKAEGRHTWSYFVGASKYRDETVRPLGSAGYAYDSVDFNANIAVLSDLSYRPWQRFEVSRAPAGALLSDLRDTEQALNQFYRLSGNFDFRLPGDRELQVNALIQHRDIDREKRQVLRGLTAGAPVIGADTLENDIRNRENGELSLDYEFPLGAAGKFTAVAFFNIEKENKDRDVVNLIAAGQPRIALEDRKDLKTESILRGTYDWPLTEGQTAKAGIEAALNTQDSEFDFFTFAGVTPVRVPIFNSDSLIKEYRAEIFANHRWEPNARWQVESGLTVELSDLNQNGSDVDSSRALQYLKPTLEVFYKPGADDRLWLSLRRDVSQLDFLEFVATIKDDDQELEAGNPRLKPEKSWDLETGWEHKLPNAGGFLSARAYYRDVSDVSDKISFDGRVSQPGNIGDGREYGAELEASLKLAGLGLWDGTLTSTYLRRSTRVTDPFSGAKRRASDEPAYELSVNYKHEIKPLDTLLTFIVSKQGQEFDFELDNAEREVDQLSLSIFADYNLFKEFSIHAEVGNILDRKSIRERTFYLVNAIDGRVGRRDRREATWGRYYLIAFKGQF
ncbi:MAG: TonB-dependent receptor [Rhodospirillaceae bacterium]|nr:TonB-dependent receptor [Rhodospirillaceae bacterium]